MSLQIKLESYQVMGLSEFPHGNYYEESSRVRWFIYSFIQGIFTEACCKQDTARSPGDKSVNKKEKDSFPHSD